MLKVDYWKKGSREKSTEVFSYQSVVEILSNAQDGGIFEVGCYLDILKERMQDDEECGLEYLIEKLEKLNPKTKICEIDAGNGEPVYFVVKGFEGKKINDDFYIALLSSEEFWNYYSFYNISINGKSIWPINNGIEILI